MAARVKVVKAKSGMSAVKDREIGSMFNRLLGTGDLDMDISYPRFLDLHKRIDAIFDVLNKFAITVAIKLNKKPQGDEILKFVKDNRELIKEQYSFRDLSKELDPTLLAASYNQLSAKTREEFSGVHQIFKNSETVKVMTVMCSNLVKYNKFLKDIEHLNHKFILNMADQEFKPLPFTSLNFHPIFVELESWKDAELKKTVQTYIMKFLHRLLKDTYEFNKLLTSPEVNVSEFVGYVMGNIDKIEKHIPGCRDAFSKIKNSVGLLEGNFGKYYQDFVGSGSPTIIMENFVADVAKNTNADSKVTRQFVKIVNYYKEIARKNKVNDPRINSIFGKLSEGFSALGVDEKFEDNEMEDNINNMEKELGPARSAIPDGAIDGTLDGALDGALESLSESQAPPQLDSRAQDETTEEKEKETECDDDWISGIVTTGKKKGAKKPVRKGGSRK